MNLLYPIAAGLGVVLLASRKKTPIPVSPSPIIPDPVPAPAPGLDKEPGTVPTATMVVPGVPTQETYVQAAKDGTLTYTWVDLPSAPGWQVTSDAIKLDGVRIPVTARTAQQIADILGEGARLTTPLLEDLIESDASIKVVSPTQDFRIMHTPEAIGEFNSDINQQLIEKEAARNELISCVGKSWVLTVELETKPKGTSCNYGMFRPDGPYMSITNKYRLWQQPGYRHNIDHWDYSQVLRLCRPKRKDLAIPAHDGCTLARQPGVDTITV